jgi:CHAT domain-containing protein
VDDDFPENSALVLSQIGLPDPLEAARSGERIYDGLLTAKEIVREWELNADLVTLSACETGLGKTVRGEGYIGFAHAFFQAGARSMLVSLWKVEDEATALLMERFYRNRAGGAMTKAEALREAKLWLREQTDEQGNQPYAHPYYWSAFVLIGDRR